ncbi:hypothetical protein ACQ5SP_03510 [Rhodovulum sp. YNF3179]|uniref:hypothetical protein n=1 Tax=Rhodovulum sp. YNF3179 TaxID=3425127 RepID=UPI003D33139D
MSAPIAHIPAALAAVTRGARRLLEVILHIGAHRTATTSFQQTLEANRANLRKTGLGFWGPAQTRAGLLDGLGRDPAQATAAERARARRSRAAIAAALAAERDRGTRRLVVSEENMMGTMRGNLAARALYPGLAVRLARIGAAFPEVRRVALGVRGLEDYWASACAYAIAAGLPVAGPSAHAAIAAGPRSWRDVVRETAAAFPRAEVTVWAFDDVVGRPAAQLAMMTGGAGTAALPGAARRQNASLPRDGLRATLARRGALAEAAAIPPGPGRYMPFDRDQRAALRIRYAADLAWLRSGAAGLARFTEDRPGLSPGRRGQGIPT